MYWSTIYVEYIVLANLTIFKKCGKLNKPKYSVFFTLRDFALRLRVFHHTVTYAQSKALRNMTVDNKNYVGTIHCLTFRIFTIHCLVYTIHCLVGTIHSRTGTTNFVHNAPSIRRPTVEGANLDGCLVQLYTRCKRVKSRIDFIDIYTITWLLYAFSLVVNRDRSLIDDLIYDTHRWRQIYVRSRQHTCFSFFMTPKSFNKPFEFLLY